MLSSICRSVLGSNLLKAKKVSFRVSKMSNTAFTTLSVTVPKEYIYHVELNRPDRLNAMDRTMWLEMGSCFAELNDNENCRAVVLSASGRLFTAGIDLKDIMNRAGELAADDVARRANLLYKLIVTYQNSISSLELCKKPILAAVHSACIGAGVDMITAADMRYCTNDAWFQVKEEKSIPAFEKMFMINKGSKHNETTTSRTNIPPDIELHTMFSSVDFKTHVFVFLRGPSEPQKGQNDRRLYISVDIGMAADVGTLQRLPKVIGSDSLARELCYTARKMHASEALSCGLVSKLYDTKENMLEDVIKTAEEIAQKSPVAIQTTKKSLVFSRDHTAQEGLDHIALLNQCALQSEDFVNATMAQLTKEKPVFSKL